MTKQKYGISCLVMLMILCSSVLNGSAPLKQNYWIMVSLSALIFLPLILVYIRLSNLNKGKNIYQIMYSSLGKIGGMIGSIILVVYSIFFMSLVLKNFTEFSIVIALTDTPTIPILILFWATSLYITIKGFDVLSKWAIISFLLILASVVITISFSYDIIDFTNILPFQHSSFSELFDSAFSFGFITFGELVCILTLVNKLEASDKKISKFFLGGFLIGSLIFLIVSLRNLLILGPDMCSSAKFPSFLAARLIHVGNFFERLESIISFSMVIMGITKMSVALFSSSIGMAHLLKSKDHKVLAFPISLLSLALSAIVFTNTFNMSDFVKPYKYITILPQVILPVICWIISEIKNFREKKKRKLSVNNSSQTIHSPS